MCHTGDCGCGHHVHHAPWRAWHPPFGHALCYGRWHFPTREELVGELEGYLSHLQAEAKGVEERLAELKKAEK